MRKPSDLAHHTLIVLRGFESSWHGWLKVAGVTGLKPQRWLEMGGVMQTLQAAQHGLGVALTYRPLIGPGPFGVPLASPFRLEVPVGRALWLVYREADRRLPKIVALRRWLLQEIAALD